MGDGRRHRLTGDELAHDRLAHGYAVTVHRSQGATHDTVHVLEDGGGRELAYVKMSRARDRTTVYAVADDLDQVAGDLRREWGSERRQRWAIDTGTPVTDLAEIERNPALAPEAAVALRHERFVHEREVLEAAVSGMAVDGGGSTHDWIDENPDVRMRLELMAFEQQLAARTLDGPSTSRSLGL